MHLVNHEWEREPPRDAVTAETLQSTYYLCPYNHFHTALDFSSHSIWDLSIFNETRLSVAEMKKGEIALLNLTERSLRHQELIPNMWDVRCLALDQHVDASVQFY